MIEKLVEVPSPATLLFPTRLRLSSLQEVSLMLSSNTAAQSHSLCMDDKVAGLVADVKKWRDVKKVAIEKAKKAEKCILKAEEAKKKTENELTLAQSEHSSYL